MVDEQTMFLYISSEGFEDMVNNTIDLDQDPWMFNFPYDTVGKLNYGLEKYKIWFNNAMDLHYDTIYPKLVEYINIGIKEGELLLKTKLVTSFSYDKTHAKIVSDYIVKYISKHHPDIKVNVTNIEEDEYEYLLNDK